MTDLDVVERSAATLVLTEWKKVRTATEADAQLVASRRQASRYARGALGGLELARYRYVILVSEKVLPLSPDERDGDITYRHVNLAVDVDVPSRTRR